MKKMIAMTVLTALAASPLLAADYTQVLTWEQVKGTGGSRAHYGTVIDGDTAYNFLSLADAGDEGRITKLTNVSSGTPVYQELVSTMDWFIATGGTSGMTGFYGYGLSGDYLQFSETFTDSVWRVHKDTGAITQYASTADILAATGQTSASCLSPHTVGPDGEHYFYEGTSDSILRTNGANNVEVYISDVQLTGVAGNDNVSGGFTFDAGGNLIWGTSTSDGIYSWDGSAGVTLLSQADIIAVTGGTSAGFGDIFGAPDGLVYFFESSSDGLMSFDPANPTGTLAYVLTEADLLAGPGLSDSVGQLDWYNGNIGWAHVSSSALKGFYAVPEPMTLSLLGLGALAAVRRRR